MSLDEQRPPFLGGRVGRNSPHSARLLWPWSASAIALLALTGCGGLDSVGSIKGSGQTVTKKFEAADFSRIAASSAFQVTITQGEKYSVVVTVDDNLEKYLNVARSGATLRIALRPNVNIRDATLRAEVTLPDLTGLELSGATRTTIAGFSSDKPLDVELSGASSLRGTIKSGDARFSGSGASHVELEGSARNLTIKASGASTARFDRFASKDTFIEASGASHVTVNASGRLVPVATGASSVRYLGTPESVTPTTSGASSVRQR